jgi:uncharacterized membrane protein
MDRWQHSPSAGQRQGRAGLLAALAAALALSACVSNEQAVDMGLATQCDASGTVARLGDPDGRFLTMDSAEVCKGPRRDSYNETTWVLTDCLNSVELRAGILRQSADPVRRGPDYDNAALVTQQKLRLKVGLVDFGGVQQALQAASVPVSVQPGQAAEQCIKMAG